ncbi:Asp-tRNA(Asn)/Glu-tRNA(Gln) amidotransferase subunit GatC [Candidatus Saccharibacteria bacterium]|nr:Asp-tRNA(Asn)/Glu-tRNA(Gln) amidotransferase subunit GatC [Candidatus Saccharibacteria bacterium]
MAKLTVDEIQAVAKLARIQLQDNELASVSEEVSSILDFVMAINEVDTARVVPTSQVTGITNVWREDEVHKCKIAPKDLLSEAPDFQDGCIKVKKVL